MSHEVNTRIWESLYESLDEVGDPAVRDIFSHQLEILEAFGMIEEAVGFVGMVLEVERIA